jgi:hypothetical protein
MNTSPTSSRTNGSNTGMRHIAICAVVAITSACGNSTANPSTSVTPTSTTTSVVASTTVTAEATTTTSTSLASDQTTQTTVTSSVGTFDIPETAGRLTIPAGWVVDDTDDLLFGTLAAWREVADTTYGGVLLLAGPFDAGMFYQPEELSLRDAAFANAASFAEFFTGMFPDRQEVVEDAAFDVNGVGAHVVEVEMEGPERPSVRSRCVIVGTTPAFFVILLYPLEVPQDVIAEGYSIVESLELMETQQQAA